jgi:hypothetical protein
MTALTMGIGQDGKKDGEIVKKMNGTPPAMEIPNRT